MSEIRSHSSHFGQITPADFRPSQWARNAHIQTIFPRYCIAMPNVQTTQERVRTPDDDFVDLSWHLPLHLESDQHAKGIVIIFHGLQGSIKSHYAQHLIAALAEQGFISVLMHFRGCSEELNVTHRAYHSGATEDPLFITKLLKQRYANLPMHAVGFSLGGNMLLKLLSETPSQSLFESCVAVSAPLRLDACAKRMERGFSKVYQAHLLKSLKANLLKKMQMMDLSAYISVSAQDIMQMTTFYEFDHHATAPLHGFASAQDYYDRCSALPLLHKVRTPTLVLHAQDDPFMNDKVIPTVQQLSPSIAYELATHGGHVGFFTGSAMSPKLWLPQRILGFLC